MRSIKFDISNSDANKANSWDLAAQLTAAYLSADAKADSLLEQLPSAISGQLRASTQTRFLGALRHGHRCRAALRPLLRKQPRPLVEAVLLVAGFELCTETAEKQPKIVHHAVDRAKRLLHPKELGLINALLRKLPTQLAAQPANDLANHFSHPNWLVDRWLDEFGPENCQRLLEWNQQIPSNYLKDYSVQQNHLPQTQWPRFHKLSGPITPEIQTQLSQGRAYIKDPSTRLAPELLNPQAGDRILDLCAAPGGKAFDLAKLMHGRGQLTAIDLPGNRIQRLQENLAKLESTHFQTRILEADILELDRQQLPDPFDCVMLDAPCSNTGVIQRRTDVKWRLKTHDIAACAKLQLQLLHSASRFVRPGGRLVYSTCSIEQAENAQVVTAFLNSKSGQAFQLADSIQSYPWESQHDGAGAFLLIRSET